MYDVAIIGAGVVGCAIARELSRYNLKTCVIEKSYEVSNGSSKANSGIVHAGYDALPGTLKAKLNVEGNKMFDEICSDLDVPFKRCGSIVVAFNEEEMEVIRELYERGKANKVPNLEIIDKDKLFEMEPNISKNAKGGLYAKTGGIVSPYELTLALGENASQNGVEFKFNTRVIDIQKNDNTFTIKTNKENIKSSFLVNAAGLFSDDINRMAGGKDFNIIPRQGEYCLLDKTEGNIVSHVVFQTPTRKGKGILVTPTTHGNLLIGPNSIQIKDKEDTSTTTEGMDEVIEGARRSVENISIGEIITSFTGLRATPSTGDFVINIPVKGMVNAAGIESPGLTASPAIALMVVELLKETGLTMDKKKEFISKRERTRRFLDMTDEEKVEAIKRNPLYGRIICRCEGVTEGDIVDAINRPLGARTVDGIKKRLRAGMGRCQGGFCLPRVVDILSRELNIDKSDVLKSGDGSYILTGRTK